MQIVWASGLGITLAYQWSKPIPLQMKIIHSRVAAQVGILFLNLTVPVNHSNPR